jgi:hypothetical protein
MSPLWRDVVDRAETFYNLQNSHQQHYKHHSDSGQQLYSLPDIALEGTAGYFLHISLFNII